MNYFLELYKKHKEKINYLIFGVLTTLVNFVVYFLLININVNYIISNIIAWFVAVLFAYYTNRLYVFEVKNTEKKLILKEMVLFFSSRFISGFIETALIYILVSLININEGYSKIFVAVIVVILNYIFSKFIVFKEHK